jgi:hypothetical protein
MSPAMHPFGAAPASRTAYLQRSHTHFHLLRLGKINSMRIEPTIDSRQDIRVLNIRVGTNSCPVNIPFKVPLRRFVVISVNSKCGRISHNRDDNRVVLCKSRSFDSGPALGDAFVKPDMHNIDNTGHCHVLHRQGPASSSSRHIR